MSTLTKHVDKHGPDKYDLDKHGLDRHGLDKHGLDIHGRNKHGLENHDLDKLYCDKHALDKHGFDKSLAVWIDFQSCLGYKPVSTVYFPGLKISFLIIHCIQWEVRNPHPLYKLGTSNVRDK